MNEAGASVGTMEFEVEVEAQASGCGRGARQCRTSHYLVRGKNARGDKGQ